MLTTHIKLPFLMAVIFFFICSGLTNAQDRDHVIIQLHDNSKIKGNILDSFDSSGVNLVIDEAPITIPYGKIRTIRLKTAAKNDRIKQILDSYSQFEKGYYHSIGLGVIGGNDHSDLSVSMVNGYKFHKYFNGGLGVGYDRYQNLSAIPVFLEAKGYVMEGKFIPYYFGQFGYGFTVEETSNNFYQEYESQGGIYWKLGVGYQVNLFKTALAFSLGYVNQNTLAEYNQYYSYYPWMSSVAPDPSEVSEKRSMRRVEFKINLLF